MTPLSYIELKLCQAQAKIFEESVSKTSYSSPIFIRRFAYSSIAKSFDDKVFLYRSETMGDVFDILDEEFGESHYGEIKYSPDQMFWIGYIYRCICIEYILSSKSFYKLFNAKEIIKYYNIYHTFDIVDAAERMMESIDYDNSSIQEKAYKVAKRLFYIEKLKNLIGKKVKVLIDRPIGCDHDGIVYPLNYGYIKEIKALDGEYQDAYVLGIDKPVETFEGKVLAIINRKNDIEDKLVVCGQDEGYSKEEIKKAVNFQEKYFKSKILLDNHPVEKSMIFKRLSMKNSFWKRKE